MWWPSDGRKLKEDIEILSHIEHVKYNALVIYVKAWWVEVMNEI
jgi:hypothetical protein